jgi:rhodanese-related sulfurtransferase
MTPNKAHNAGFLAIVDDAKTRVKQITLDDYKKLHPAPLLIDVREDTEWAAGHAAGAMHLGKGVIERDIETKVPDKSTPMVLYCGGGFRSSLAADVLQKMGYSKVLSLDGGWRAWNTAAMPVETGP